MRGDQNGMTIFLFPDILSTSSQKPQKSSVSGRQFKILRQPFTRMYQVTSRLYLAALSDYEYYLIFPVTCGYILSL